MLDNEYPIKVKNYNNYLTDRNTFFYKNKKDPQFLFSEYKKMNYISNKNNLKSRSQRSRNVDKLNSFRKQTYNNEKRSIKPNNNSLISDISEIVKNDSIFELLNNIEINKINNPLYLQISNYKNYFEELKEKIFELNNEINEKNKIINNLRQLVQGNEEKYEKLINKKNNLIDEIENKYQKYYKQIYILENRVRLLEKENKILKDKNIKLMYKIKSKNSKYYGNLYKKNLNENYDIEKNIRNNNKNEYFQDNLLTYYNNHSERNHYIHTKQFSSEDIEQKNNDSINLIISNIYNNINSRTLNDKKPNYTQSYSFDIRRRSAKYPMNKQKIIDENFRYLEGDLKTKYGKNFYSYNKLHNNIKNY